MHTQHNYVISVKNNTQRRNHIISEFGKQNIPFEFFDAITPDIIEQTSVNLGIDIKNSPLTKGEIACALSHITLWKYAKEQNLDYICIFEDDIYWGEDSYQFLHELSIPKEVDFIKLEKCFKKVQTSLFPDMELLGRKLYRLKSSHCGTGAYIITKKGIDFLLDKIKSINEIEIDNFIFHQFLERKDYVVLQVLPAICIQDVILNDGRYLQTSLSEREERWKTCKKNKGLYQKLRREIYRFVRSIKMVIWGKVVNFK